jgi:hypothetical protein
VRVLTRRTRLTVVMLLIAMLATSLPAFASATHEACVTLQHACDDVPTIAECCCGDANAPGGPATPAEPRVQVTPAAALATAGVFDNLSIVWTRPLLDQTTLLSPRLCLLDLPTLLATLLI